MSEPSPSAEESKEAAVQTAIAAVAARHDPSVAPFGGDHAGLDQLERMVRSLQASAATLAAFPMTNANEPMTIFVARDSAARSARRDR